MSGLPHQRKDGNDPMAGSLPSQHPGGAADNSSSSSRRASSSSSSNMFRRQAVPARNFSEGHDHHNGDGLIRHNDGRPTLPPTDKNHNNQGSAMEIDPDSTSSSSNPRSGGGGHPEMHQQHHQPRPSNTNNNARPRFVFSRRSEGRVQMRDSRVGVVGSVGGGDGNGAQQQQQQQQRNDSPTIGNVCSSSSDEDEDSSTLRNDEQTWLKLFRERPPSGPQDRAALSKWLGSLLQTSYPRFYSGSTTSPSAGSTSSSGGGGRGGTTTASSTQHMSEPHPEYHHKHSTYQECTHNQE